MPTKIYDIHEIELIDGTILELSPLKIKYLRQFMDTFELIKECKTDEESISVLVDCVRVSMKQFHPALKTIEDVEDSIDLPTIYKIIDICAGVKMNKKTQEETSVSETRPESKENSWDKLDLVKLESEIFVLGAWKNFDELESNISMPELMAIIESIRELDYNEKKFLAAMQGVDLDESKNKNEPDPWEAMKARVAAQTSGIGNGDPNDVLSLQGQKAQQYGFGIGMGLDYEVVGK
jgi:alpha-N-acetylglucosamine transferase